MHNYNMTWPNFELTRKRELQGDIFYFLSLKSDAVPPSSVPTKLLSFQVTARVTWYKDEKVVKDAKSIFQRGFHLCRRCRIVISLITTLRRPHTNFKDKNRPEDRQGAVYKIKCCDCQATYIGETSRILWGCVRATRLLHDEVPGIWFTSCLYSS